MKCQNVLNCWNTNMNDFDDYEELMLEQNDEDFV